MLEQDVEKILLEEIELLGGRTAANIIRNKQNATMALINSLRAEAKGTVGALYAYDYLESLEKGIPPNTYVSAIILNAWGNIKGYWQGKSFRANTISRRIMNSGSLVFRKGGRTDVYTKEIPLTEKNISERVGAAIVNTKIL